MTKMKKTTVLKRSKDHDRQVLKIVMKVSKSEVVKVIKIKRMMQLKYSTKNSTIVN